jgi:PAS domain S-box-containing protein
MAGGSQSFDDELVGLFDHSQDAFCIAGFDGYLKRANPAFPRSLGYTLKELLASPFVDNIYPGDRESVEAVLAELAAGNPVVGFECRHVRADGSVRWFEWSTSSRPEAGVMYGVARDVTERRLASDELGALRRVSIVAAEGAPPSDLFAVLAEEVARVMDVPVVTVVRYEPDAMATVCSTFPTELALFSAGTRLSLDGTTLTSLVRDRSAAVRVDDYSQLDGGAAAAVLAAGVRAAVGVPIVVAGRLWGAMEMWSRVPEPLPDDIAERLAHFTELLATAIASAESREALARLAEQQAALRRVATLVARGTPASEVFAAVAEEMARCLGTTDAEVFRHDLDGGAVVVAASYGAPGVHGLTVGERLTLEGDSASARVLRTGRAARMDSYEHADGTIAVRARELGLRSRVGAPIVVDGHVWGVAIVGTSDPEPLPSDSEVRIAEFADLVATAIANAATRDELQASRANLAGLATQQSALRRVATLVARGASPSEVFSTVTEEMAQCLNAGNAGLGRFEDDEVVVLAVSQFDQDMKYVPVVGERIALEGDNFVARVFHTGSPARVDSSASQNAPGPIAERVRELGLGCTVAVPIVVDGRVWGTATVGAAESLPPDTEARIGDFADLVATAIANAATRDELIASRARIVAAGDEARRGFERDLHDGAQQRLVSLGLELRAAEACVPADRQELKEQMSRLVTSVAEVSAEVQEISRGIHPAILSRGGLGPALKTLARRSAVPVDLDLHVDRRFADSVEVGAYYVVAEALTNAAKHARASVVEVCAHTTDRTLRLEVRDDGIGGAAAGKGSGLTGLVDRVEALGGRMTVQSPAGSGTSLLVYIPLDTT